MIYCDLKDSKSVSLTWAPDWHATRVKIHFKPLSLMWAHISRIYSSWQMKYQNDAFWSSTDLLICAAKPITVERYEVWNTYIEGTCLSFEWSHFSEHLPMALGTQKSKRTSRYGNWTLLLRPAASTGKQKSNLDLTWWVDMTRLSHPNCSMNIGWAPGWWWWAEARPCGFMLLRSSFPSMLMQSQGYAGLFWW